MAWSSFDLQLALAHPKALKATSTEKQEEMKDWDVFIIHHTVKTSVPVSILNALCLSWTSIHMLNYTGVHIKLRELYINMYTLVYLYYVLIFKL